MRIRTKFSRHSTCRSGVCLTAKIVKGGRQNENLFPILSVAHFVLSERHLVVRVVPLYPCRPVLSALHLPFCPYRPSRCAHRPLFTKTASPLVEAVPVVAMPPLLWPCRPRCSHAAPVVSMPPFALPKPSPVPPEPSPVFRKDNDKSRPETIFLRPVCAE